MFFFVIQCNEPGRSNVWRREHLDLLGRLDIRLKTVVLNNYSGRKSDVDFVNFFTFNAGQLETVTLVVDPPNIEKFLAKQRRKLKLEDIDSNVTRINFTNQCRHKFGDIKYVHDLDIKCPFQWLF
jgi:stress response protein SCP2